MSAPSESHVLVNHMAVEDGEHGHPMDVVITRVELDAEGRPTAASMEQLAERIARQIARRVELRRAVTS